MKASRLIVTAVMAGTLPCLLMAQGAPSAQTTQATQELPPIRAFLQVTPQFCTGGQPRPEHFAKLKADGVKAVLNLRTPQEHQADEERAAVEKAGMKYFNIPVVYTAPTDAQADEFLRITDDPANRPMFIHCTAAIRVGTFWMIRRVLSATACRSMPRSKRRTRSVSTTRLTSRNLRAVHCCAPEVGRRLSPVASPNPLNEPVRPRKRDDD